MQSNNELALKNTQPTVKDGPQERFWEKFQEIQKRELSRVQKQKESELRMKRRSSLERYRESAKNLAERWFGWDHNDFNDTMRKTEELVILDRLLLRKTRKKLLAVISGAAVLGPMIFIADFFAASSLNSLMSYALSLRPEGLGTTLLGVCGWIALIIGNGVVGVILIDHFMQAFSSHEISFLRHRKLALLELREQEKESRDAG